MSGLMYCARYLPSNLGPAAFGQWWNQSQNATTGYLNGAAAAQGSDATRKFVEGYAGAVGAAMAISLGAGVAVARSVTCSTRPRLHARAFSISVYTRRTNLAWAVDSRVVAYRAMCLI